MSLLIFYSTLLLMLPFCLSLLLVLLLYFVPRSIPERGVVLERHIMQFVFLQRYMVAEERPCVSSVQCTIQRNIQ